MDDSSSGGEGIARRRRGVRQMAELCATRQQSRQLHLQSSATRKSPSTRRRHSSKVWRRSSLGGYGKSILCTLVHADDMLRWWRVSSTVKLSSPRKHDVPASELDEALAFHDHPTSRVTTASLGVQHGRTYSSSGLLHWFSSDDADSGMP